MISKFHLGKIAMLLVAVLVVSGSAYNGYDYNGNGESKGNLFGIKGGITFSTFWGEGVESFEETFQNTLGGEVDPALLQFFTGGVFYRFSVIPDFVALQPEVLYVRRGRVWDAALPAGGETTLEVYTDYLSIPILFKLLIPFEFITPSAYLGPELSVKLRSQIEGRNDLPFGVDLDFLAGTEEGDISDIVNSLDVGLATGIGIDIEAGPGAFVLDFRYAFGFLEAFEEGTDVRNSNFAIMAGYGFRF